MLSPVSFLFGEPKCAGASPPLLIPVKNRRCRRNQPLPPLPYSLRGRQSFLSFAHPPAARPYNSRQNSRRRAVTEKERKFLFFFLGKRAWAWLLIFTGSLAAEMQRGRRRRRRRRGLIVFSCPLHRGRVFAPFLYSLVPRRRKPKKAFFLASSLSLKRDFFNVSSCLQDASRCLIRNQETRRGR